jgi:hypothetical protein
MKIWKDRQGNKLTLRQFLTRWKTGLQGVTPFQQTKMQIWSMIIIIIGIVCGFVITLFAIQTLWWLTIILGGAFFNSIVQLLGLWQKKNILKNFNLHIPAATQLGKDVLNREGEEKELPPPIKCKEGILQ